MRAAIPGLLAKYNVRTYLDIPCGDAYRISQTMPVEITYIGADIVPALIERNRVEKGDRSTFEVLDLVSDTLPRFDLVMVRDCFTHLPHSMVKKAIANVKCSGARHLLGTTYPSHAKNIDIGIGGFRPVDLQADPYLLPVLLEMIRETEGVSSGKSIGLWDVSVL